ncbi:MAG: hypothetical protein FJ138_12890, partial [Deltaproteobacteria bacterium]|nr:hypothetical protein [Deltaproteobacteria bacterium]
MPPRPSPRRAAPRALEGAPAARGRAAEARVPAGLLASLASQAGELLEPLAALVEAAPAGEGAGG